ncbi:hypothetical protein EJD97_025831 [Solanum chilense]|uniref:Putative plant transposon protein domain-containing protein n=1 Tax=Solanum chilense TaxID=4083 RepID=A0A6N2C2W6_SOLCI|nr:hypothetical protein EJD97_025831 [Solanum chilense]
MTDPMTVHYTHDGTSPGPSCFTATTEMALQLCSYVYFVSFLLVLFAPSSTNNDSLHVLSLMAPKQDQFYAHGLSKSIAPSARLVIGSDDEHDPEYVPPGSATPARAARATRATPKMLAFSVVTASHSDEEFTLIGTPSGSATQEEGVSGSLGVLWSEEASRFAKVSTPATVAQSSSSDEADSRDSTPGPPIGVPALVADQPKRWCVDRQYQVYSNAKLLNDKEVMTRTLTIERRATPATQAPLEHVRVRSIQVDISLPAIRLYLYGEDVDTTRTPLTAEFDYRWKIVKEGQFWCEPSLRETTKRWMAHHLSIDEEAADWAMELKGVIRKANLNFKAMFLWLIVHTCLSPTAADNIVTWDRTVLMAAMMAGFEVCPSGTFISSRLHRAILILASSGIRPMSWLHAQCPVQSSTAPSSSYSAPSHALVPLARVQKLEAQMATILHHIQPWMQRSISEAEERLKRKIAQHTKRNIAEVHERLDAFKLQIPPSPPREHAKRRRGREEDEASARNKEHSEMEAARRALIGDEKAHKIRVVESGAGAYSSRDVETEGGTTDSDAADEDTTEGVQTTHVVGSGEPDPPGNLSKDEHGSFWARNAEETTYGAYDGPSNL